MREALVIAIRSTAGDLRALFVDQLVWRSSRQFEEEAMENSTISVAEVDGGSQVRLPVVLIQCVGENERLGILSAAEKRGLTLGGAAVGRMVIAERLGSFGGFDLLLLQTRAGSTGPTAAQGVVSDAIDEFGPEFVIGVGVAFGLKSDVLSVDDPVIAIAETSKNYERARIGSDDSGKLIIHERGTVEHTDPNLSMKLRAFGVNRGMKVTYGEVLCGDKLVDNQEFRSVLKARFPQAVAGEMEGTGLASACLRRRRPWAIVKGISDLGDGRKNREESGAGGESLDEDARQVRATESAMDLVLSVLEEGQVQ